MKVPIVIPYFGDEEVSAVTSVIRSGWVALGKELVGFESKVANYTGTKHAVAVNSCTAALEASLRALGIEGKEVITTATSCSPTANAIIHSGNKPVMVDISMEDYNIDPDKIEDAITEKTGAILPVHLYGRPARMDKIVDVAGKYNLPVIEDCAQAMGAEWKGRKVGSIGAAGCFSFNINKIITTGEGGMVVTNDESLANNLRVIRNYGREPSNSSYCYTQFGHNFKFTNLQSALGLAQVEKIKDIIKLRREKAFRLRKLLADAEGINLPGESSDAFSVFFSFPILLKLPDNDGSRDRMKAFLESNGIEARTLFRPMCSQPYFRKMFPNLSWDLPNAENAGENGFYVGCYPGLEEEQLVYVAEKIKEGLDMLKSSS